MNGWLCRALHLPTSLKAHEDMLRSSVTGTFSIQKRNGDTLKIMNVYRTPLEDTTSADLVYYDDTYNSYIMVQYKMMTTEEIKRKHERGRQGNNRMR